MRLFWDTSAIVLLIFQEPHTDSALRARAATSQAFAWNWMRVEAEAALARRKAKPGDWKNLERLFSVFIWLDLDSGDLSSLCRFNKPLGLRALDSGHLFVFSKAHSADETLRLVTFDGEMRGAAEKRGLPVWTA